MNNVAVMFNNSGIRYCYDRMKDEYAVVGADGKEEIRCGNALQAWTYYIQRVDTEVRKRIRLAKEYPKQIEFSESDFFGC